MVAVVQRPRFHGDTYKLRHEWMRHVRFSRSLKVSAAPSGRVLTLLLFDCVFVMQQ